MPYYTRASPHTKHTAIYSRKVSRRVRWKTNIFYARKEDLFNFWASCSLPSWFLSFLAISIVCKKKKNEKIVWKFIAAFPFSDFFFHSSYSSSSFSNLTENIFPIFPFHSLNWITNEIFILKKARRCVTQRKQKENTKKNLIKARKEKINSEKPYIWYN